MDHGSGEELRNFMRSADRNRDTTTPLRPKPTASGDQDLQDLASLIGSLGIDMTKTTTKDRAKQSVDQADLRSEVQSFLKLSALLET